jgi:hypothetical protein
MGLHEPIGVARELYRVCLLTVFYCSNDRCEMATARDASGYMAALFTRAEFGCVQFSPLAATPSSSSDRSS